jgi:mannitol/fructose-specific phosphotransferase system IIA component (Ntr-type)
MAKFQPGHSGRPKGSRDKLNRAFIEALARQFEVGGEDAIRICRIEEPVKFTQICASLQPKEFQVETFMADASEAEIDNLIENIRERLEQKRTVKQIAPAI